MRRALQLAALAIIPGALVLAGIVAAYRFLFHREDTVSEGTLLSIRAADDEAQRRLDLDLIPRGKRQPKVSDGPTSRYTEVVN